jgi:hypothetical protein
MSQSIYDDKESSRSVISRGIGSFGCHKSVTEGQEREERDQGFFEYV